MKQFILLLIIILPLNYGYAQKVIYSKTIVLKIPAKTGHNKDTTSNILVGDDIKKITINYLNIIDSIYINKNEVKAKVNVEIDTINKGKQNYQELNFTFEPVWATNNKITDFPSGEYNLESSGISMLFTKLVKETLENKILNYTDSNDLIIIRIKGTADAISIKKIKYRNEFGKEIKQKYFYKKEVNEVIINNEKYITTNRQLAFLRTYGIRDYLAKNISELANFQITFEHYVEVYEGVGASFRTISIDIIIRKQISN